MRRPRFASLVALILTLAMLITGCTRPSPTWVDEGASYTVEEARALLDRTSIRGLADTPTTEADSLRQDALATLRNKGKAASAAASLVTRVFPPDVKAVPVYVEMATVGDRKSLILIEAWGSEAGDLALKRLWIVDAQTGDVIESAAAR